MRKSLTATTSGEHGLMNKYILCLVNFLFHMFQYIYVRIVHIYYIIIHGNNI